MGLNKGQTNSGSFKKGHIPKSKGMRKHKPNCLFCTKLIDTSDHRTKFCNHSCAMKYKWKNNINKPRIKEEYLVVTENGKAKAVHRIVFEKEVGNIPEGYVIHHINGDKIDNRIENLELMKISDHVKLHNNLRRESH